MGCIPLQTGDVQMKYAPFSAGEKWKCLHQDLIPWNKKSGGRFAPSRNCIPGGPKNDVRGYGTFFCTKNGRVFTPSQNCIVASKMYWQEIRSILKLHHRWCQNCKRVCTFSMIRSSLFSTIGSNKSRVAYILLGYDSWKRVTDSSSHLFCFTCKQPRPVTAKSTILWLSNHFPPNFAKMATIPWCLPVQSW